jgi:hypothetical protein
MEVASLGSRAKMRAKEGEKGTLGWNEMEWNKAESRFDCL